MKKILFLVLFCQNTFCQNTIFKSKVPFVTFSTTNLFGYESIEIYHSEVNIDSILSKNPNLKTNFNKAFVLEKPLTQTNGKIYYPMYVLVLPNDTISLESEGIINSNFQNEVDVFNKMNFEQEWLRKYKNNYSIAQKDSLTKQILKMTQVLNDSLNKRQLLRDYQIIAGKKSRDNALLVKTERFLILDSAKEKLRTEVYDIIKKMIEIKYYTEKNQANAVQRIFVSDSIKFENTTNTTINLSDFEKEFELINSIKPDEYQIYSFLIQPYLESACRLLTAKINDNKILENKAITLNSKLNFSLRDLFMSNIIHNLARTSRLSMRLLYDFYDNCEEQILIDNIHQSVSYGRLTANDVELKETKLATLDGESLSWGELLAKHKGKIVYDIILEEANDSSIAMIQKVKNFKTKNPEIIINFITKSNTDENWIGIVSKLGILSFGKHYRLDSETLLTRVLTENVMPRGVLISKEARIVSIHSNDPSAAYFAEYLKEAYEF